MRLVGYIAASFALVFLSLPVLTTNSAAFSPFRQSSQEDVVNEALDATVHILNRTNDEKTGSGTGFFIDENTIITNHHVIANSKTLLIKVRNNQNPFPVELVGSDEVSDIAVLRIKDLAAFKKVVKYSILPVGDSRALRQGQRIFVLGNPWGLDFTVSEGIVSALSRRVQPLPKFLIQTDAHLYQGNSGGPMIDAAGRFVAVNSMMVSREGGSYGLAAPSELVMKVVNNILAGKETKWPVLGLVMKPSEDGLALQVESVGEEGSAIRVIKKGDILTRFKSRLTPKDGVPLPKLDALLNELAVLNDGEEVTITVRRDGKERTIAILLIGRTGQSFAAALKEDEESEAPKPAPRQAPKR